MMAAALPRKNEGGSIEGRPTLSVQISNVSLPPPPPSPTSVVIDTESSFNLDAWLESNNLLHLKEVFMSHNMTTFDSINTANSEFALLIASPLIIESNIVSDVVRAIQKLHSNHNNNIRNTLHDDIDRNTSTPSIATAAAAATEYIVVSSDEHDVLQSLKQCLFDMNKCKTKLEEICHSYLASKQEIRENKRKHLDKCKEKINLTFGNLSQIIQNRQDLLLSRLDAIRLSQINDDENKNNNNNNKNDVITAHMNEIDREIKHHSEYINKQITEYKTLIESTKTNYDALDALDACMNERDRRKKVKVRRRSIIQMGSDSQHLHKRQRLHILAQCEKLKRIIEDATVETYIDFVLDDKYLNQLLIYMQHSFGFIVQNIPKPNIKSIYFSDNRREKLAIELKWNELSMNEYEIMYYEVAYFVHYYDDKNASDAEIIIFKEDDNEEKEEEEHSSNSSGSSLFSDRHNQNMAVTEGAANDPKTEEILWKFIQIEENNNNNTRVVIKCTDIEYDIIASHTCTGELRIKMRSYLMHQATESKFWSAFSNDFIVSLDDIGLEGDYDVYGTPKHLPKWKQTPESSVIYHLEEEDDEKKEYFEKYYNLSVSDPVRRREEEEKYDELTGTAEKGLNLVPIFSINPLSESGGDDILNENDENNHEMFWNDDVMEKEIKLKRKSKEKRQRSWGHSLNLKLNGLFGSNSNIKENETLQLDDDGDDIDDAILKSRKYERAKTKPFAKRTSFSKRVASSSPSPRAYRHHAKSNSLALSRSLPLAIHQKKNKKKHHNSKKKKKRKRKEILKKKKAKSNHQRSRSAHMDLLVSNNDEMDTFKILLLGASDGGKTTVFKQIRHIKNGGNDALDERQRKQFRILIIEQILDSLVFILDKIDEIFETNDDDNNNNELYRIDYSDQDIAHCIDVIRHQWTANDILRDMNNNDERFLYRNYLLRVWQLRGVQNMYKYGRNEIENVSDSITYFMNDLDRILKAQYIPTMKDILFIRKRTIGVNKAEIHLNVDDLCIAPHANANELDESKTKTITICAVDVGGAVMERKKWKYHFIGVTAVFYIVGLSGFDEKCFDLCTNTRMISNYKLQHELNVFDEFMNCKQLCDKQWILFLNKVDLFAIKIQKEKKSIAICFKDYISDSDADAAEDINQSIQYISQQFSALNQSQNKLYTHVTCAVDTKFITKVLHDTFHIIINNYANNHRVSQML